MAARGVFIVAFVAIFFFASSVMGGPLAPSRLRVEYRDSPLGLDVPNPRFAWVLVHTDRAQGQSAYQIVVTEATNGTVYWDSGKVASTDSQQVEYAGDVLPSDASFNWAVSYWDVSGVQSAWSNSSFTTGLFSPQDWGLAKWIGVSSSAPGTLLRKSFTLPAGQVAKATVYIIGLGYYKLDVDGVRVSEHELGAFTTYQKRVWYDTWDITQSLLTESTNHVLAVFLGNGWYSQPSVNVGPNSLYLRMSVQFVDGSSFNVYSDLSWKQHEGPVLLNDIYLGETYSEALEVPGWNTVGFDDSSWGYTAYVSPPSTSVLISSHAVEPYITIAQDYSPVNMWETDPGVYVFDFGQNMAGFTTLYVPEGLATVPTNISITHAETLLGPPPNTINQFYSNAPQVTTFMAIGSGNEINYTPYFTYMGFQYAEIRGYPGVPTYETLTAHFIHTAYDLVGSVGFSDPLLNQVQHITRAAAQSNFQSIPTDCPQRERRGWLGDAQLSAETNIYNFDMAPCYTSFIQQIQDAQDPSGSDQDCVPYYGHGGDPADPAWGSAYVFLTNWMYTYYGDTRVIQNHYSGLRDYMTLMISICNFTNPIYCTSSRYGDWCPAQGGCQVISGLVSAFELITEFRVMAKFATILGNTGDAAMFTSLADEGVVAFNNLWFDESKNIYYEAAEDGTNQLTLQAAIALAVELGAVPESNFDAVFENLVNDVMVTNGGHLTTGIVGIKYLLSALSDNGRTDVALAINQVQTQPSYVYMVLQGATTLWETWQGSLYDQVASRNHIMFGSQGAWYFKSLGGIQITPNTTGFTDINIAPQMTPSMCQNLSAVDASVETHRGIVSASWSCGEGPCGVFPENSVATLSCPPGGVINAINFASFGTPSGSCSSGFQTSTCNSPNSMSVVEAACLNKASCSVTASNTVFGGDPCYDTLKHLSIQATCSVESYFTMTIQVPVGSTSYVTIPGFSQGNPTVTESGTVIWANGSFQPGVPGVTAGSSSPAGLTFTVLSGTYSFNLS